MVSSRSGMFLHTELSPFKAWEIYLVVWATGRCWSWYFKLDFLLQYKSISDKCRNKIILHIWYLILSRYISSSAWVHLYWDFLFSFLRNCSDVEVIKAEKNQLWVRLRNYIMTGTRLNMSAFCCQIKQYKLNIDDSWQICDDKTVYEIFESIKNIFNLAEWELGFWN